MGIKLTEFTVTDGSGNEVTAVQIGSEKAIGENGATAADATTADILIDYVPLSTSTEKIAKDGTCTYEFVVRWNKKSTNIPTNENPISKQFNITFTYEQDTKESTLQPNHDTTNHTPTQQGG